jgi:hypothetical protein
MYKLYLNKVRLMTLLFLTVNLLSVEMAFAATASISKSDAGWMIDTVPYSISPPEQDGPIKVKIAVDLLDIYSISDHEQSIGFKAEMKLTWTDPRNAFDPNVAGVDIKTLTGDFQWNELSTGWYPQVVLLNEYDASDSGAILYKVKPDGSSTLFQTKNASAKVKMDLKRFPFDSQKLGIKFALFGYDTEQMVLEPEVFISDLSRTELTTPEWVITNLQSFIGEMKAPILGADKNTSTFTLEVDVKRKSTFVIGTIIIPLILIVLLSFAVFWLDVHSIQDRLNVSFIGVLTITAYQLVIGDSLPHVSYFTLVHWLIGISLIMVCLSIAVNVFMKQAVDNTPNILRLNYACKWAFPILYISSLIVMYVFEIDFLST